MKVLEEHLLPAWQRQRRKVVVLYGLGGMGKTQLSVEFIRRHHPRFGAVFWLDGRSEDNLRRSLAAIVTRLPQSQVPEASRVQMPENTNDLDMQVKTVTDWLDLAENTSWLLVFDNVDQDFRDGQDTSGAYDVRRYFPAADHGSILITTRLANLDQLGTPLRLGKVDSSQALAIFQNGCGRDIEGECPYNLFSLTRGRLLREVDRVRGKRRPIPSS